MIEKNKTYAVVGASKNPQKYGYKVLKDLHEAGYRVIPINPKEKEIIGLKAIKNIIDVGLKIDVVVFVVPPNITEKVLKDVKKLNIKKVWLQPGSESKKAIKYCENNNINCVHSACVMISRLK